LLKVRASSSLGQYVSAVQERLARLRPYRFIIIVTAGTVGGLLFALWAHVWPVSTVSFDGATVECGSLWSPRTIQGADPGCSIGLMDREMWRLLGLLVALGPGLLIASVAVQVRLGRLLWHELRLVNGSTAVRSGRRSDRRRIGATIDEAVTSEMGWTTKNVDHIRRNVGKAHRSGVMVVTESVADRPIGAIWAAPRNSTEGGVELGGWMGASNRHEGHMTRAIEAISTYWIGRGAPVFAECSAANAWAQRILSRVGFTVIGEREVRRPDSSTIQASIHVRFPETGTTESAAELARPSSAGPHA
jgi:hypothetical protein